MPTATRQTITLSYDPRSAYAQSFLQTMKMSKLSFNTESLIHEAHMKAYDFSEEEVAAMPIVPDDTLAQYMTLEELDERLNQSIKEHMDARFCIEKNYNGEIFILVHDAIHSKLYHD